MGDEGRLVVGDSIEVETDHGTCEIQLCFGSVTEVKKKVDVLVISAFPGDYSATPTSVIGALKRDLSVSVRDLAKNKEEDLRKLWSCWWSKKLPDKLPFKRIMCFEGGFKKNSRPPSTISEVFRSLVSLCKNKDISVMMPLLGSGNQGYSQQLMLRMIVEATIHWMKIGLQLRVLKIVVYCHDPSRPNNTAIVLLNAFRELKENWKIIKDPAKAYVNQKFEYDIYLAYSNFDVKTANKVAECLSTIRKDIRIFKVQQEINSEESWQKHIYEVMVNCERVIALLSPTFLGDAACIEKYNIALCCSHSMRRDYLAPLYIEEIQQLPTYMGLIQYVDCRPVTDSTIQHACDKVTLTLTLAESMTARQKALHLKNRGRAISLDNHFDVFISYSHKDAEKANAVVERMQKLKPKWNIFIDQSGLRAGSAWQKKLYTSIENSKVVVAFLSKNYMESKVCQEEYNLARALQDDPNYMNRLVELKLDIVDMWPIWCTPSFFIDLVDEKIDKPKVKQIVNTIEFMINARQDAMQNVICIREQTSLWRKDFWRRNFPIVEKENFHDSSLFPINEYKKRQKYDVVICFHSDNQDKANVLVNCLRKFMPNICISFENKERSSRLHDLDEASIIVTLLSASFLDSNQHVEEFQIALCRHRFSKDLVLFPIIVDELPLFPAYPQLTLCLFSLVDSFWYYDLKCLRAAATVLCNILVRQPQAPFAYVTFMSMLELEEWTRFYVRNDDGGDECDADVSPIYFTGGHNKLPIDQPCNDHATNQSSHLITTNNSSTNTYKPNIEPDMVSSEPQPHFSVSEEKEKLMVSINNPIQENSLHQIESSSNEKEKGENEIPIHQPLKNDDLKHKEQQADVLKEQLENSVITDNAMQEIKEPRDIVDKNQNVSQNNSELPGDKNKEQRPGAIASKENGNQSEGVIIDEPSRRKNEMTSLNEGFSKSKACTLS